MWIRSSWARGKQNLKIQFCLRSEISFVYTTVLLLHTWYQLLHPPSSCEPAISVLHLKVQSSFQTIQLKSTEEIAWTYVIRKPFWCLFSLNGHAGYSQCNILLFKSMLFTKVFEILCHKRTSQVRSPCFALLIKREKWQRFSHFTMKTTIFVQ